MLDVAMMTTIWQISLRSGHVASQAGKNRRLRAFPLHLSIGFDAVALAATANEIVLLWLVVCCVVGRALQRRVTTPLRCRLP